MKNEIPSQIINDISEEDTYYAMGGKNYQQYLYQKHRMIEANCTQEERARISILELESNISDDEMRFDIAFETVISERNNVK